MTMTDKTRDVLRATGNVLARALGVTVGRDEVRSSGGLTSAVEGSDSIMVAGSLAMSLSGAWRRVMRLPACRPDLSRFRSAMRRSLLSVALLCLSLATVLAGGAAAQEVSFSSGTYRANEGDALRPELVLSQARSEAVTVRVEALDLGEAKSGEDFAADPWHVTIPAGQKRQAFSIATVDDDKRERNEQFLLHIAPYGHSPGVRRSSDGNANADAVAVINDSDAGIPIPVVAFSSSTTRVREGVGTHDVKLNLSPAPSENITLRYGVYTRPFYSRGIPPATAGSDFEAQQYVELPVPKGATTAIIPVTIINDDVHEGDENFWLGLRSGTGYRSDYSVSRYHNVVIIDDDPRIEASFASALQSVDEGVGARDVTVNLTPAPASDITLDYTVGGTATAGADYTALSGTLSVSADATTATIPVAIIDDSDREGDETVVLTLTGGGGHRIVSPDTHTLTIAGSDGPPTMTSVSFASASQSAGEESGTRNVAVNLTPAPESDITLSYTVGGTATAGSDYTALPGTLTVPAGATTATIPVALVADSDQEDRETVVLTLAGGTGYRVSDPDTHVLTIGTVPTVTIPRAGTYLYEGAGTHHVAVHLSPAPPSGITLYYTVTGTATSGQDYQPLSGTVSVPARAARVFIPVTIIDDSVEDSGEFIRLTLVDKPGYTVERRYRNYGYSHRYWVYIFNHDSGDLEGPVQARLDAAVAGGDSASANLWRRALAAVRGEVPPNGLAPLTEADAQALAVGHAGKGDIKLASLWAEIAHVIGGGTTTPPPPELEVAISAGASPVTEGGDAVFTVTADPAPASSLAVTVTVAADGAYGIAAGERKVTIPATGSATLTLATTNDEADEPDGSVTATVKDGEGYTVGSSASGSVSIQDNDEPPPAEPSVTISAGASPVTEGGDAVFTVTADPAPASSLAVTVTVAADGAYGIAAGERKVTIPATGSATLTLATTNDEADEPDGSVTATVKDGEGYTVGSSASGSVSIQDNDEPPPAEPSVTISAGASPVTEGGDAVFTVTADSAPASSLSVTVTVAADGAYGIAAGERKVTIPATGSATLTLATTNDEADEPDGSVTVTVEDGEGYTVDSSASGTVAIADDDSTTTAVDPALIAQVRGYAAETHHGQAHVDRWNRVLAAFGDDNGNTAMTAAEAQTYADRGWQRWVPVVDALAALEAVTPPVTVPAVSISAGDAVTEGGDAVFTVTASPAPAAELTVTVTVAADGEYGVTAGEKTVTIPTGGSATLTLATTNDDADEPDGSVTVTVEDGDAYTVGDPASGAVTVEDDDLPPPAVSITAKAGPVTEGGDAVFTVSASRAPDADLAVTLAVADAPGSDFVAGADEGERTVTIPDGATSAVFTLATANDEVDEPDGVVTVTLNDGEGYTVGAPATGSVSIADDDLPPPVVSIAAKAASVTEGGAAAFTLTADRAPDADLTVTLSVAETGDGDHLAAADEGSATAVIAKGATEAVFSVATVDDDVDEPDGSVTVTLKDGGGYTVSPSPGNAAAVTVSDNDAAVGPSLSVADVTVTEGAWMEFTLRLSAPSARGVAVKVSTRDSTPVSATARKDYWPLSGRTVSFRTGETERRVGVIVFDDSHDEEPETFEVVLSDARGAAIADGVAVGTIVNDDPMPAAWLARFGRTVAEQALDGIAGRMSVDRTPGLQGSIAGQALSFDPAANDNPGSRGVGPGLRAGGASAGPGHAAFEGTGSLALAEVAQAFGGHSGRHGAGSLDHDAAGFGNETQSRSMTARDALLGSSFSLTGATDGSGGSMAFWGRAVQGSFDGREGTFSLDGAVTTGMLGADYARSKWLVGLALAQSEGEGDYRDTGIDPRPASQSCPSDAVGADAELCRNAVRSGDGSVEASLTAAMPYAALQASERLRLWGAAGYGTGEVTLKTAMGGSYKSDTTWSMAAAGLRGDLLAPPAEGSGPALAVTSDALWTRTSSEKTDQLAASESDATRLRLGLEGSYRMALEGSGSLVPKLEVGARHDGGDAETGFGVELGGGIAWSDPALGLSLDVSGRTLIAHGNDDLKDRGYAASLAFDPDPATQRGPSLSLRQEFGGQAQGGLDALFQPATLEDRTGGEANSRWTAEAAYGFPAFGGRWTGSPHAGFGLATGARDYTVGWRLTPASNANAPDLSFGLRATRRESDTAQAEHTGGVEITARW